MFKLGCTDGCDALCEPPKQVALLLTKYLWMCEECHGRHCNKSEDERAAVWDKSFAAVKRNKNLSLELQQQVMETMHQRERTEEKRLEPARMQQVEEIQWVSEWTLEYGSMLWDVLYEHQCSPEDAAKRIEELRGLRLWDLVVAKDVLRSTKELEADHDFTPWIIGMKSPHPRSWRPWSA
jgi:hypothetical protein